MSYKNLHYIIEIAQQNNISKAAERLFISQSALSIFLKKTEKELGVNLFIRNNNFLTPTPEGELFIATAREILRLEQELYAQISPQASLVLNFGVSSELAMQIFSSVFLEFKKTHLTCRSSIIYNRTEPLIRKLKDGSLNFIIIGSDHLTAESWMCTELLKKEELVVVIPPSHPLRHLASRDYDRPPAVDVSVFGNDKFVIGSPDTLDYVLTQRMFNDYGMKPDILYEINQIQQSCQMVQDGIALTLQPEFCVPRNMDILVCKPERPQYRYLLLGYRKDKILSKEEKRFLKALRIAYEHWYDGEVGS